MIAEEKNAQMSKIPIIAGLKLTLTASLLPVYAGSWLAVERVNDSLLMPLAVLVLICIGTAG